MHVHLPPDNALKLTPGRGAALSAARRHDRSRGRRSRRHGGRCGAALGQRRRPSRAQGVLLRSLRCRRQGRCSRTRSCWRTRASAAAEAAARRVKAAGATFMKFYDGLTEPMIRALERACARHGLKIMGHVPGRRSPTKRRASPRCSTSSACPDRRRSSATRCSTAPATGTRSTRRRMDEIVEMHA